MKKQLTLLTALAIGVIATLLLPTPTFAAGESYSFTESASDDGYGGPEITAFKSNTFSKDTVFTKVTAASAKKDNALVNGYTEYYKTGSFNLTDKATIYPNCKTDPAYIALKSDGGTEGFLYVQPGTSCASIIGFNLLNLSGDMPPTEEIIIGADMAHIAAVNKQKIDNAYIDGYYKALASPLNDLKSLYYSSLGSSAPCSSQGCDDSAWKEMVGKCWQSARSSAADAARYAGQGGISFDLEKATREAFANCMAGKVNGAATPAQIYELIKTVSVDTVNASGAAAAAEAQAAIDAAATVDEETETASSSCVIEGLGWIVCPVINFLASVSDLSFSLISKFLIVNVKLFDTNSGTYAAWSSFRNLANVAFVIVFLIIIYSQLTGQGISNYGVKKTLPRLVVAAVLVNISFYVCQLAVDVTQIIGGSIVNFFDSIPIGSGGNIKVPTWTGTVGDVLGGVGIAALAIGGAAAGVAMATLSISSPVLLAAVIAILMTVIILVGRQAAIVILIILAPLAFVAFMLPNTEKWFKKWYQAFLTLLMVFPIVALLYGGGQLASKIIANVANSSGTESSMKFWLSITAIGVASLPLIMTPSLLKASLNGLGSISAKLSGFASKANGRVGKAVNSSRLGEARQGIKNRFALRGANRRAQGTGFGGKLDNSSFGKAVGLNRGAGRALEAVEKEKEAEVNAEVAKLLHNTTSVNRLEESEKALKIAIKNGDVTGARAAQKVLLSQGAAGIAKLQSVYSNTDVVEDMEKHAELTGYLRSEINSAGLKGKNNALARWGYQGSVGSLATADPKFGSALAQHDETYTKLNAVELAGQSIDNLRAGSKHITPSAAAAVLSNDGAASLLDGDKLAFFTAIAGSATPTGTAAPPQGPGLSSTSSGNTSPGVSMPGPHNNTSTTPPTP